MNEEMDFMNRFDAYKDVDGWRWMGGAGFMHRVSSKCIYGWMGARVVGFMDEFFCV